ncbi:carbon-nitrogen hydrolase [Marasmius fiardii PR-910]|nr:carbon-nitrogen hydrolase [Marasmius fiardii PR-910]
MPPNLKIAAVQSEPCWNNLTAAVNKTISIIKEAAADGAQLIGFPEAWIPGYPGRIWVEPFNYSALWEHKKHCLSVKSPEYQRILQAVKDADIWVILGMIERDGESMYCAQSFINPSGVVVLHRRKIKPTGHERTIWGDGPADSLKSAVEGPGGVVIGALNCWENILPLLRFNHYMQGVQIPLAAWPYLNSIANGAPPQMSSDFQTIVTRNAACEGPMFVICSTQIMKPENFKACGVEGTMFEPTKGGGFAAIYGPDGTQLTRPLDPMDEAILYADIDLDNLSKAKLMVDPVGHYSRPDLLSLYLPTSPEKPNTLVKAHGIKDEEYRLLAKIPQLEMKD